MVTRDVECIRARPEMFVGHPNDSRGIANLLWEVVRSSIDQHLGDRLRAVAVVVSADGAVTVSDDGPGVDLSLRDGVAFPELVLTTHVTPDVARPQLVIVNALSEWLELDTRREGRRYRQRFERGVAQRAEVTDDAAAASGTSITFLPDGAIFGASALDTTRVIDRLTELGRLSPGLALTFEDRRCHVLSEPRGLEAFVADLGASPFGGSRHSALCRIAGAHGPIGVDAALRWELDERAQSIRSFANLDRTTGGGTHVRGFLRGLVDAVRFAMPETHGHARAALRKALRSGLNAVVRVRLHDPKFFGSRRARLINGDVAVAVRLIVAREVAAWLAGQTELRGHLASRVEGR